MTRCYGCRTTIKSHLWLVDGHAYCSPSCERGGKSLFAKTYRALANIQKSRIDKDDTL